MKEEFLRLWINNNPHAPPIWRVNSLMNNCYGNAGGPAVNLAKSIGQWAEEIPKRTSHWTVDSLILQNALKTI